MKHELFREDKILTLMLKLLGLSWKDDSTVPYLCYDNGEILWADEYDSIGIDNEVLWIDDKPMICDGVLLFGDGTLEFHELFDKDAYNWEMFDEESLQIIEENLENLLQNQK